MCWIVFFFHYTIQVYLSTFIKVFKKHLTSYIAKVFKNFLPQRFFRQAIFPRMHVYESYIAELDTGKGHKIQGFVLAENVALLILIKSFSSPNRGSVY